MCVNTPHKQFFLIDVIVVCIGINYIVTLVVAIEGKWFNESCRCVRIRRFVKNGYAAISRGELKGKAIVVIFWRPKIIVFLSSST